MKRIGIIGSGYMGAMHAACYRLIDGAEVVAVADVRAEQAAEIAAPCGAAVYTDAKEMMEKANLDVVDICLPTFLHTEYAVHAMKCGLDVFVEKPICLKQEEADLLLKTQKETGREVMVGQVVRSIPEYAYIKELQENGTYGKVKTTTFRRLSPKPGWAWDSWLHQVERSGSMALDLQIHDIDYMRYLLGEPTDFNVMPTRDDHGLIGHMYSTFRFGDAVASVEASWDYPTCFPFSAEVNVEFEKATAVCVTGQPLKIYEESGMVVTPELPASPDVGNVFEKYNVKDVRGYFEELTYFIEQLEKGEPIVRASLTEAVRSFELVMKEIDRCGGMVVKGA